MVRLVVLQSPEKKIRFKYTLCFDVTGLYFLKFQSTERMFTEARYWLKIIGKRNE